MEAQREVEGVGRGPSEKPPKRSEWTEDVGEEMKGRCIGRWAAEIQTIATSSLRELLISTKTFFSELCEYAVCVMVLWRDRVPRRRGIK